MGILFKKSPAKIQFICVICVQVSELEDGLSSPTPFQNAVFRLGCLRPGARFLVGNESPSFSVLSPWYASPGYKLVISRFGLTQSTRSTGQKGRTNL